MYIAEIEWTKNNGRFEFKEIPGSEFELKAELVLLAMGFLHIEQGPVIKEFGLKTDVRGNLIVDSNLMTSEPGVFAAGDSVMGASLVVRAIDQGRKAAETTDKYLADL